MSRDLPPPESCPGVIAALQWLLRLPSASTSRQVLRQARYRLISIEPGGYWRVHAEIAARLLRTPHAMPSDPEHLATVLHGLGELSARSHCDFITPILPATRRFLRRNSPACLLKASVALHPSCRSPISASELGHAQMMTNAKLEWETFRNCEWFLWHPGSFSAPGQYGLKFTARLLTNVSPHSVGRWIASCKVGDYGFPIAAALLDALAFHQEPEQARRLLSMPVAFLRCAGAAALVWPDGPHEWSDHRFMEIFDDLVATGLPPGDALWMTASRLKECFHRRFRLEQRIREREETINSLGRFPETAAGGHHNANNLITMYRRELAQAKHELADLLGWIDKQLDELAACYPEGGLTDRQHSSLEPIFIDMPEYRYRLAKRLPAGAERELLLQRTINRWVSTVENGDPYLWRDEDSEALGWTARTFILLHSDRPHMGKIAGRLLGRLLELPKKLVGQPYAPVRKPEEWRKATGQMASVVLFAFAVIEATPTQRRRELDILREHAIDTAFTLLVNAGRWWPGEDDRLDNIALSSIWHLADLSSLNERLRAWAKAEELPDFPRALCAWCVRERDEDACQLAEILFHRVARFPMSRNCVTAGLRRLLSLLDVASACRAGNTVALLGIWPQVYRAWDEVTNGRWRDAARCLAAAVEADGPERKDLLGSPEFSRSFCRAAIEREWPVI